MKLYVKNMTTIEENAKKIETMTRVARLLGDQLREQNKKIELLQEELLRLKNDFLQKKPISFSSSSSTEEEVDKTVEMLVKAVSKLRDMSPL